MGDGMSDACFCQSGRDPACPRHGDEAVARRSKTRPITMEDVLAYPEQFVAGDYSFPRVGDKDTKRTAWDHILDAKDDPDSKPEWVTVGRRVIQVQGSLTGVIQEVEKDARTSTGSLRCAWLITVEWTPNTWEEFHTWYSLGEFLERWKPV